MRVFVRFTPQETSLATHRVLGDGEMFEGQRIPVRAKAPCPAIWFFNEHAVTINEQWQYATVAANPGMELQYISALFNNGRMVSNTDAGFGGPTPKRNYILRENLLADALPRYNKCWTMTGTKHRIVDGAFTRFDGNSLPPLKPGRVYPARVEDVNPDDYLYTPQNAPHLFFNCVNVDQDGSLHPFPNGAVYSWTGDNRPRSFLPFLSSVPITYPPARWADNSARLVML